MNVRVIMPFYRKHLTQKLTDGFRPMNVIWHPVCDEIDLQAFEGNLEEWIKPVLCPPLIKGQQCYRKVNDFINTQEIVDEDLYGFLHDDDMYVPGFIDRVRRIEEKKIFFFSMDRGDVCPVDDHPVKWPPVPIVLHNVEEVRVYNIDMCMMIVRGDILRQTQFGITQDHDDGLYAVNLRTKWPNDCLVITEYGVRQNYFQKGRFLTR